MTESPEILHKKGIERMWAWRSDWNLFCEEAFGVTLDDELRAVISSVQHNQRTSVASGTARGKDFTAALCALCFLYLTPKFSNEGELIESTKVILSAPTSRQIGNIMVPEFTKLFNKARSRGIDLPGRLVGFDIRTNFKEWFMSGFKADENQTEAWSGLHAPNIMFVLTEASGIADSIFNAIEGNLQGNSRILLVFNPNVSHGYAAESQRSPAWNSFSLNSLTAPNVVSKKIIIPGQVDYSWVKGRIDEWCTIISPSEMNVLEEDFQFEGVTYRPNDLFRVKVLGRFGKISEGQLIPQVWIDIANERWKAAQIDNIHDRVGNTGTTAQVIKMTKPLRLGNDVAGMGRDATAFCFRYDNYVEKFEMIRSTGENRHMEIVGKAIVILRNNTNIFRGLIPQIFIDTIGEGAGGYSRMEELSEEKGNESIRSRVHSVKFSEAAKQGDVDLKDRTEQYKFLNMRAYLMWAVRDWLDPESKTGAMLPPDKELAQEMTETQWKFRSNGSIQIEDKEEIKARLGRSTDKFDALATTFYPVQDVDPNAKKEIGAAAFFPM